MIKGKCENSCLQIKRKIWSTLGQLAEKLLDVAEALTDKLCTIDKKKYGVIKNITDKDYYSNSYHLDVRKKWTPFDKLSFESPYPMIASGGNIDYFEAPDITHNLKALETVWDYANKVGINYLGTNVPIDTCTKCGFHGQCLETARGWECPQCGAKEGLQIVQRICGYLGEINTRPLVHGRMSEIEHRVHHDFGSLGVMTEKDDHVIRKA